MAKPLLQASMAGRGEAAKVSECSRACSLLPERKGGNVPSLFCSTYLKGRCAARGIVKMSGRHQRWGPGLGCLWSVRRPNTGPGKNHSSTQSRCGEQKQPTGPHPKKPAPGARGRSWALGWEKPVPECVGVKTSAGELGTRVHANPQA